MKDSILDLLVIKKWKSWSILQSWWCPYRCGGAKHNPMRRHGGILVPTFLEVGTTINSLRLFFLE
jgi:hypothetical protein